MYWLLGKNVFFFHSDSEFLKLFTSIHDSFGILFSFIYATLFIEKLHFVRKIAEILLCVLKVLRMSTGKKGKNRTGKASTRLCTGLSPPDFEDARLI